MIRFYKKTKYGVVMLLVLAMILQVAGPVVGNVYATGTSEALTVKVYEKDDRSTQLEWKFDLEKANGKKVHSAETGLTLKSEFPGELMDGYIELGTFKISKDGLMTVTIHDEFLEKPEEVVEEEEEEEITVSEVTVEIDENSLITISAKVTGTSEDEKAKVEIINEEQEVVGFKEDIEIQGETAMAVFENLKLGKYYAKVTVDEISETSEVLEIEEAEEPKEEGSDDDDDDDDDDDESEGEGSKVEEVSIFGEPILTVASTKNLLGGLVVSNDEDQKYEGEITIPFDLLDETTPEEGNDLGNTDGFKYYVNLYLGSNDEPVEDGEVIEIEGLTLLTYRVDFEIPDRFTFKNGEELTFDLKPLTSIQGLELPERELSGRIIFTIDKTEIDAASYEVINGELKVTFDNALGLNGKTDRKGFVELGFIIEKTTDEVEVIEKIDFLGEEAKTFYILRKFSDANSITKDGSYDEKEDEITWTIDINKDFDNLTNAKLIDKIPAGLTVTKIELYDLTIKVADVETTITEEYVREITDYSSDTNEEGITEVTIDLGDLNRVAKRIKITTTIDGDNAGSLEFKNEATLKSENKADASDHDILTLVRVTGISKTGKWTGEVNKIGNKITWTVEFRGDGSGKSYDLVDTPELPEGIGLVLIENSVKLNGHPNSSITVSQDVGKEKFIFKGIPNNNTELQTLEYTTEVIYKNNIFGEDKTYEIKNKVVYNEQEAEGKVSITRGSILSKDNGSVIGADGKTYVDWKIDINKNNESWTNVEIWEYIPAGFTFINAKIGNTEIKNVTDRTEDGKSYKIIPIDSITQKTTVTVRTELTDYEAFKNAGDEKGKNIAKIKWKPNVNGGPGVGTGGIPDDGYDDIVEGNFGETKFTHTLSKSNTVINYKAQTATWKVVYTTYDTDIKGLEIVDELLNPTVGDHKYVQDSLKLTLNGVEYALENTIGVETTVTVSDKTLKYKLEFDETGQKFTLNIISGNINNYYNRLVLTYDTEFKLAEMVDLDTKILKNKVKVRNGIVSKDANGSKTIEAHISKNGKKSGEKVSGENRTFNWTVELNHKGKTIDKGKTIIDKLTASQNDIAQGGEGELTDRQRYDRSSIGVYSAKLQKDGTLVELVKLDENTDYSLNITSVKEDSDKEHLLDPYDSGMEIKFINDLKTPIIIKYKTESVGISVKNYANKITYNDKAYPAKITYKPYNKFITKELLNHRNQNVVKGDILKWKLTINTSLSEIHNFVLEDKMSDGLVFIEESLTVNGKKPSEEGFTLGGLSDNGNGFKLSKDFVDEKYTVEYETLVTASTPGDKISNNVYITGDTFERSHVNKSSYNVISRSAAGGSGSSGGSNNDYKITIKKVDVEKVLITSSEARFKLITVTTIGEDDTRTTEELATSNGTITIHLEKNKYNRYFLEEIEAPNGYAKSEEEIEIKFGNDKEFNVEIINTKKTEVTGKKVWIGGPAVKPTIELQLYRNDAVHGDTVKLSNGNTEHTWKDLDETDIEGTPYKYTVDEVEVGGYNTKITGDSKVGFTITNTRKSYAIGDYTWIDSNKDGIQNEGEPVLPGVKVELYNEAGEKIRETTTNEDGLYIFDELEAGNYKVKFTLTEEQKKIYKFTKQNSGDDTTVDSDANPETGWTVEITLDDENKHLTLNKNYEESQEVKATQGIDPTWDAGVIEKTYAIGDYTWVDSNKDGIQDENEPVLVGVKVELFTDKDVEPIATTYTNDKGLYIFDELEAGKYYVKFTLTPEQAKIYEFTKLDTGENTEEADRKDSDANPETGWTIEITLDDENKHLTKEYEDQVVKATEGIDPTWDAGVIFKVISVTGAKEWIGGPSSKPTIELQLSRGGKTYGDPVELKNGEIEYTWDNLDEFDKDGVAHIYTVDEVKVPRNYSKRISENGLTITNRYNPPTDPEEPEKPSDPEGRIRIVKKDNKTNELLSGAEFDIVDSKGKVVDTLVTNNRGQATSKWLPIGNYTIQEVKAPKGYKIDSTIGEERIRNGETLEIAIYNEKDDPTEPEKPVDPEEPTDPEDPEKPTEPTEPTEPGKEDEFEDVDGGNPSDKPEGEDEFEDGGGDKPSGRPKLPKTGTASPVFLYGLGGLSILIGTMLRRKKED